MAHTPITQTLSDIPLRKHHGTVNPNIEADKLEFEKSVEAYSDHMSNNFVPQINTAIEQINIVGAESNANATSTNINAQIAVNSVTEAQSAANSVTSNEYIGDWTVGEYTVSQQVSYLELLYTAKKTTTAEPTQNASSTDWYFHGSSTAGTPINGIVPLNFNADVMSAIGGVKYLKSGVEKISNQFPLATRQNYIIHTELLSINKMDFIEYIEIGDFFYVLPAIGTLIIQTDKNFNPTGIQYTLAHNIESITYDYDRDEIWVKKGASNDVLKYSSSFVYIETVTTTGLFSGFVPYNRIFYAKGFFWTTYSHLGAIDKVDMFWNKIMSVNIDSISNNFYKIMEIENSNYIKIVYEKLGFYKVYMHKVIDIDGNTIREEEVLPIVDTNMATQDGTYYYQANWGSQTLFKFNLSLEYVSRIHLPSDLYYVDSTYADGKIYVSCHTSVVSLVNGTVMLVYSVEGNLLIRRDDVNSGFYFAYDELRDSLFGVFNDTGNIRGLYLDKNTLEEIPVPAPVPTVWGGFDYITTSVYHTMEMNIKDNVIYARTVDSAKYSYATLDNTTHIDQNINIPAQSNSLGLSFHKDTQNGLFAVPRENASSFRFGVRDDLGIVLIPFATDPITGLPMYWRVA